jgi:hypothetical protein
MSEFEPDAPVRPSVAETVMSPNCGSWVNAVPTPEKESFAP